jgi:hypothetical protein
MRSLTRVLLAVGTITMLSATLALGFNESGIDYLDPGIETAYVSLSTTGHGLTVSIAAVKETGYVGTMDVENLMPDIDDADVPDYYGSRPWAPKAFAAVMELKRASTDVRELRVRHDQLAPEVMTAYTTELTALGYTVAEDSMTSNITVFTATKGDEMVRLVFVRRGTDTLVTLSPS